MKTAILQTPFVENIKLENLADKLDLKIITEKNQINTDFILYYDKKNRLCLQKLEGSTISPICVDFASDQFSYRRRHSSNKGEMLAKAVGIKKDSLPFVLDATAGLGKDSFMLATLGCSLIMLEQSPIIAALLADGLERANKHIELSTIVKRINLITTDSVDYLSALSTKDRPDVIYLDPMFPSRKKNALAKKEMQTLQELLENNNNEEKLFNTALKNAKKRVVVKRHKSSPVISDSKPDIVFTGKSCRFDVYLIQ